MLKPAYKIQKLITNSNGSKVIALITTILLLSISAFSQTFETSSSNQISSGSSITLNKPTGTASGEFLLVVISLDYISSGTFSTPSGWTKMDEGAAIVNEGTSAIFYKVMGSSEPSSYTFSLLGNGKAFAQIVRYSGVDSNNPIENQSHTSPLSPYNVAPSTFTTYLPSKILRILRGNGAGMLLSMPFGYSQVSDFSAHGKSISIIDAPISTIGTQTVLTVPNTVTNIPYRNSSIILRGIPTNPNAPTQGNEHISTNEDVSTSVNVLLNNTDLDGDIVTLNSLNAATSQGGVISYTSVDSMMTYIPPANFSGIDTAFYTVKDDGNPIRFNSDSIFITVIPVNYPSQGNEYINLTTNALTTVNLLANNIDPDGDLVWVSGALVRNPINYGFTYNSSDSTLIVSANSSAMGVDSIFYTVTNGLGEMVLDTVFVNICGTSDCDGDGDGVSNEQEIIDGTDPFNPCDYLGIVLSSTSGLAVCEGTSVFFNNQSLIASGTYKDTLSNISGCDSIITLDLTIIPTERVTLNDTICDGDNYIFNGTTPTSGGTYSANLLGVNGCDSIVTLNLTIEPTKTTILNEAICNNSSYAFNGTSYNTTGTYTANLSTSEGCDSTVTLNLTVSPTISTTLNEEICDNSNYVFNGISYNTTGTYTANLTTSEGCDSTVILNLTVAPRVTMTLSEMVCDNDSYLFNGMNYNATGTYMANLLTSRGCDSTVILNLMVNPLETTILNEEICANTSYFFNGTSYNSSGAYVSNLLTTKGCDSIVTLNLMVHPMETTILNETICEGGDYLFNNIAYSSTGTYSTTILSSNGCDSTITLNLVIGDNYATTIHQSICQGNSYTFNNKVYSSTGIYQDTLSSITNCDSIFTLNIVSIPNAVTTILDTICQGSSYLFNGINYTTAGTYTSQLISSLGCDSIVTLDLTLIPCIDLALRKDLAATQSDTVRLGETIHYEICVNNENITPAYNIEITDHLPQGMVLDPNSIGWTLAPNNKATYTIPGPLTIGQRICVPIQLNLLDPSTETINNYAEISEVTDASGVFIEDFDSVPGGDLTNSQEDDIDFVPVIFNPCPSVIVGSFSIDICMGDTIQLIGFGGSVGATYLWNGAGYLSCTDCPNPFVSPDTATTYVLTIQEVTGCSASNFSRVIVHNPPELDLGPGKNICSGNAITLNAGAGATTYQWTASDGSIVNNVASPSVMPLNTATYCVTITDAFSCTVSDCTSVNVREELSTTLEEQICMGTFYDFNGQQLSTGGVYIDTLISTTGCDSIVTLNLSTEPCVDLALQKDLAPDQSDTVRLGDNISYNICINNEGVSPAYNIEITDHLPQGMFLDPDNIGWTLTSNSDAIYTIPGPLTGGQQQCIPIHLNLLDPSTQTINNYAEISGVTDERGIFIADFDSSPSDVIDNEFEDDIDFIPVFFDPCPSVIVGSFDIDICEGDTIQLEGFGGSANATYQWGGAGELSCTDCPKPFVSPDTTTLYVLTIKEITGCEASNFSRVKVHAPPVLNMGVDKNICSGTTITLGPNITATSYEWTASDSSLIAPIVNPSVAPLNTTDYCLTIMDEFGCTVTDCITVFVKETLRTNLQEQICDGSFYAFDGQELTASGTYIDTLQSSTGCDSIVTLQLSTVPCVDLSLQKDLAVDQSDTVRIGETIHYEICIENEGISPAYNIEITDHIPAGLSLSSNNNRGWTLLTNNNAIYTIDGPLETGDIVCVPIYLDLIDPTEGFISNYAEISGVTDERGIFIADFDSSPNNNSTEEEEFEDDIDFETIYFDPCPFVLIAGQRVTICEGDSIVLEAIGGSDLATYEWGLQNELSCYDCNNPIASPQETTVYLLTIHEITGCSVSTTVTVNVQKNPAIDLGEDQFICLGTTTNLSTNSVGDFKWTTSDGTFLSNESILTVSPSQATTYCVDVVGEDGCSNSDCVTVFVEQTLTTNISKQICAGNSYNFNGQSLIESGQYRTTLIATTGCDSIVNLDLVIVPAIRTEITDTICIGTSYEFEDQILTAAGTYTKNYTANDGCDSTSVLMLVTENCADLSLHTQLSTSQNATVAIGDTVEYEIIVLNEGTVPMHTIQIVSRLPEGISPLSQGNNGWTLSKTASFLISNPLQPGNSNTINLRLRIEPTIQGFSTSDILTEITAMHYADGTLAQDKDSSTSSTNEPNRPLEDDESILSLTIQNCKDFTVSAGAFQRVCQEEAVLLEAKGGSIYQWSPSASLNQATVFNPLARPLETTIYTVTATDENGCTATDQVQVIVENCATPPACNVVVFACPDKTMCKDGFAQLVVSGGVSWEWSPRESLTNFESDIPIAAPTVTTQYTVTVTDENGCTGTDQVIVFVEDCAIPTNCEAIAFACPDKTVCKGRSAQLVVNGGVSWEWSPRESLNDFNLDIPVATPTVTTDYTVTVTDQNGCTIEEYVTVFVNDCRKNITDTEKQIMLQSKAFLQGAMLSNEGLMQDKLRVKNLIPLVEPYTGLTIYANTAPIFTPIGSGGETIAATVLETTGPDAIVDWVFLELRWEYDPSKVISTRSALIQRDGDIVDIDGDSPVQFNIPADNYFLAVRHRNHLGVMTKEAIPLKRNSLNTIDFTKNSESCYVLEDTPKSSQYPMVQIGETLCLWGGNSNGDNKLIFQGPELDQEKLFFDIALHPDNISDDGFPNYNFIIKGYLQGDNNMDGELRYQGPNNDIDALQFFNILQHKENERFLTNKIIYEQLPRK